MNPESPSSLTINTQQSSPAESRCAHSHPSGRRCHMPAAPASFPFCPQHAALRPDDLDSINVARDLLGKRRKLNSASEIQRVLGKLFVLLAEGRISNKRASVLTYIVQQLLRTLPQVDLEQGIDRSVPIIINDLPRSIFDQRPDSEEPPDPANDVPPSPRSYFDRCT